MSQDRLDALAASRQVLALTTGDGTVVYPTQQFGSDGSLTPHLAEVLTELERGSPDPWTVAMWVVTAPDDETYDGLTAIEWLRAGNDTARIVREAASDAARWRT